METKTVFENISSQIIQYLKRAEHAISVCVAWLTDDEILNILVDQTKKGVYVEIITLNDEHNRAKSKYFNQIIANKGKVYMIDKNDENGILHHKFCLIDRDVLITGSYNWSNSAKYNNENIIFNFPNDIEDFEILLKYENEFNNLLYKYGIKNKEEEDTRIFDDLEKQSDIYEQAKEFYESAKDYLRKKQNKDALEFINEAISLYQQQYLHKDQRFHSLRHFIYLQNNNYIESAKDLYLYMNEVNDEMEINLFKKVYNEFIDTILDRHDSYKSIEKINHLTKINLGVFATLNIEPHFFTYEELNPYPF